MIGPSLLTVPQLLACSCELVGAEQKFLSKTLDHIWSTAPQFGIPTIVKISMHLKSPENSHKACSTYLYT